MTVRGLLLASLAAILICGNSCDIFHQIWSAGISDPDPCDAGVNVYDDNTHFFERDFVTDQGRVNYQRWFEIKDDPRTSPCDPLHENYSAEQRRELLRRQREAAESAEESLMR
ncbi:MAG: hypothetical protein K1X75_11615 [Leptospirales bacterium]|nr:hypothetical protein [Leptospirales bacterium]